MDLTPSHLTCHPLALCEEEKKKLHFQQPTLKHFSAGGQKQTSGFPENSSKFCKIPNKTQTITTNTTARELREHYSVFLHLWFLPSQVSCSGEEQEPPGSQVQQGHPALPVGANPGVEQARLHRAGSSAFPCRGNWCSLQAPHILLPLEHTPALLPCHFYLSSLSPWAAGGKKISPSLSTTGCPGITPHQHLPALSQRLLLLPAQFPQQWWDSSTAQAPRALKSSFSQVLFQLQGRSVHFSIRRAEHLSCHALSAAAFQLLPQKHLGPSTPRWKWFWGMSWSCRERHLQEVLGQSRKDTTTQVPLRHQSYSTSQFHKSISMDLRKLEGIWDHNNGKKQEDKTLSMAVFNAVKLDWSNHWAAPHVASLKASFGFSFFFGENKPRELLQLPLELGNSSAALPALLSSSNTTITAQREGAASATQVQDGNRDISPRNQQRAKLPGEELMAAGEVQLLFRKRAAPLI